MKKLIIVLSVVVGVVSLGLLNLTTPASAGGRPFSTTLTGEAEVNAQGVPNQGDLDGSGTAHLTLNQGQGEICFDISVQGVATITAAHIHEAPAGTPGPVVVNFNVATNGLSGCVSADEEEIKEIRQDPEEYYVNVHNADFPDGALRGQLSK
jgi:hypothetical protein